MRGRPIKYSALTSPHTVTLPEGNWENWKQQAQKVGLSISEVMVYLSMSPHFSDWVTSASQIAKEYQAGTTAITPADRDNL